jgi:hypothetical protein
MLHHAFSAIRAWRNVIGFASIRARVHLYAVHHVPVSHVMRYVKFAVIVLSPAVGYCLLKKTLLFRFLRDAERCYPVVISAPHFAAKIVRSQGSATNVGRREDYK